QSNGITKLFYRNLSKLQVDEPQRINVLNIGQYNMFKIHTVNNNEIVLLQYVVLGMASLYKIIRVLLTPDANLLMTNYDTPKITEIASKRLNLPNDASTQQLEAYLIDGDVALNDSFLKQGTIFECFYPSIVMKGAFNSCTYLVAFYTTCSLPLIQRSIDISTLCDTFCQFQNLIDTKIIGYSYTTNQCCIIDIVTGNVNTCIRHMLLMNKKTTLITSFVPEST
ncbi:hypothetical protein BDF19DRAFT_455733, partial [Syncephalis fuscata]